MRPNGRGGPRDGRELIGRAAATAVRAWARPPRARYAEGVDEQGRPIDVTDPRRDTLVAAARQQGSRSTAFIEDRSLFGDLAQSQRFVLDYAEALELIRTEGVHAALRSLLAS